MKLAEQARELTIKSKITIVDRLKNRILEEARKGNEFIRIYCGCGDIYQEFIQNYNHCKDLF